MIGIAQRYHGNPMCLRATNRIAGSHRREYLTDSVMPLDNRDGVRVYDVLGIGFRFHHSGLDALGIPRRTQDTVRLMPP
jgi:hypothetical protein